MEKKKGISGSTLKMIAIVTMLIDHIGAAVLARLLMVNGLGELDQTNTDAIMQWLSANGALYWMYTVMRMIGRVAFPIFCFLLVEGFLHTHDVKKYAMRLGLFALLSEIPFDLAFSSKILEFNYQNVDLNQLAKDVENTVRGRLQTGVALQFVPEVPVCYVQTEHNRLSQVLINLLVNAAKFTEKGEIMFGYKIRGEELYFYVKDTGIGISLENQKKIFERFTKVNTFIQGTGLGLSICKNIVTKMKGRIGVESEGEGKGSTFWFTIPYKPKEAQKENNLTLMPLLNERSKEKPIILIAEDNESNYMLFKSILQKDYELVHAWDGEEAVELHQKFHPHVVIMDINMPKMDGYEATREIRKVSKTVPIIAVTAYSFASDKEKIMQNGFNGYMSKPVDIQRLKEKLDYTIHGNFMMM